MIIFMMQSVAVSVVGVGRGPERRYPIFDCTAVGPSPRMTLLPTITQYLSAPIRRDMLKLSSQVSGYASLSPRRYGNETASRWRFPNGTAMVGTISTSMAIFSLLSVSR